MTMDDETRRVRDEQQHRSNLADLERVRAHVRPRLERAERAYGQALTSLWLGNAGAAIATLSFIAGTWQKGTFHRSLLVPVFLFVSGLILMGIGSAISLVGEAKILNRMQRATSLMEFRVDDIKSSTEQAGLTLDCRTAMALISAACFVLGCCAGLLLLSSTK